MVLAGHVGQRLGGGLPHRFLGAGELVQQDRDGSLATTATQDAQGRLTSADVSLGVFNQRLQAQQDVRVGNHGQRLGGRHAHVRLATGEGGQQFLDEAVVAADPDGLGEREEYLWSIGLFQTAANDVLGLRPTPLHQQQRGLALAARVRVVVQHFAQVGDIFGRRRRGRRRHGRRVGAQA